VGEDAKPSIGLTPDERRFLRGDKFWSNFQEKQPGRRDWFWFFFGAILFWFGGHVACPIRPT